MINFPLAKEIYGNTPWMVDSNTFGALWQMFTDFRNGVKFEASEEKMNSFQLYDTKNVGFIGDSGKASNNDAELINVVNLDGVITKNGGASSNGTKQMAQQIRTMDADNRIQGHIINAKSGGGAGNAIKVMADSIREAKKPTYAFVEEGEIAASACYGIISACDYIVSESADNKFGSLGTFIEFAGFPKSATDENGVKHVRIYATKSTQKNINFEEAINNDNFQPMIEDLLNPANEKFLNAIKQDRPNIQEEQTTGAMFSAGDVLGSMVDSIGSFEDVVNSILVESNKSNNNNNLNNSVMTLQELKNNHPDLCGQVHNEGVMAEKDRAGAWMAHANTDIETVKNGIASGENITQTQMQELFVKQNNMNGIASMKKDSTPDIVVDESQKDVLTAEQKEMAALYGKDANL